MYRQTESSSALLPHRQPSMQHMRPLRGVLMALSLAGLLLTGGESAALAGTPARKAATQAPPASAAPAPGSKSGEAQTTTEKATSEKATGEKTTIEKGAASAAEEAKLQDIRRVLILTGSDKLALQVMQQMIGQFKQAMPQVPDAFWAEFMSEVNPSEIVELAVPIYARYLSHDEIKDLLRFYESPSGSKFVSVLPQITQESMLAGQTWGANIGERALRKLQEKGFAP